MSRKFELSGTCLAKNGEHRTDADRMLETVFFFAAVMPGGSSYLAKVMHAPPIAVMQLSRLLCESSPSHLTPFFFIQFYSYREKLGK